MSAKFLRRLTALLAFVVVISAAADVCRAQYDSGSMPQLPQSAPTQMLRQRRRPRLIRRKKMLTRPSSRRARLGRQRKFSSGKISSRNSLTAATCPEFTAN